MKKNQKSNNPTPSEQPQQGGWYYPPQPPPVVIQQSSNGSSNSAIVALVVILAIVGVLIGGFFLFKSMPAPAAPATTTIEFKVTPPSTPTPSTPQPAPQPAPTPVTPTIQCDCCTSGGCRTTIQDLHVDDTCQGQYFNITGRIGRECDCRTYYNDPLVYVSIDGGREECVWTTDQGYFSYRAHADYSMFPHDRHRVTVRSQYGCCDEAIATVYFSVSTCGRPCPGCYTPIYYNPCPNGHCDNGGPIDDADGGCPGGHCGGPGEGPGEDAP